MKQIKQLNVLQKSYNMLRINGMLNRKLEQIINDFKFEFDVVEVDVLTKNKNEYDRFWSRMNTINEDLNRYIYNWEDIRFYNYVVFKPRHFMDERE